MSFSLKKTPPHPQDQFVLPKDYWMCGLPFRVWLTSWRLHSEKTTAPSPEANHCQQLLARGISYPAPSPWWAWVWSCHCSRCGLTCAAYLICPCSCPPLPLALRLFLTSFPPRPPELLEEWLWPRCSFKAEHSSISYSLGPLCVSVFITVHCK